MPCGTLHALRQMSQGPAQHEPREAVKFWRIVNCAVDAQPRSPRPPCANSGARFCNETRKRAAATSSLIFYDRSNVLISMRVMCRPAHLVPHRVAFARAPTPQLPCFCFLPLLAIPASGIYVRLNQPHNLSKLILSRVVLLLAAADPVSARREFDRQMDAPGFMASAEAGAAEDLLAAYSELPKAQDCVVYISAAMARLDGYFSHFANRFAYLSVFAHILVAPPPSNRVSLSLSS